MYLTAGGPGKTRGGRTKRALIPDDAGCHFRRTAGGGGTTAICAAAGGRWDWQRRGGGLSTGGWHYKGSVLSPNMACLKAMIRASPLLFPLPPPPPPPPPSPPPPPPPLSGAIWPLAGNLQSRKQRVASTNRGCCEAIDNSDRLFLALAFSNMVGVAISRWGSSCPILLIIAVPCDALIADFTCV